MRQRKQKIIKKIIMVIVCVAAIMTTLTININAEAEPYSYYAYGDTNYLYFALNSTDAENKNFVSYQVFCSSTILSYANVFDNVTFNIAYNDQNFIDFCNNFWNNINEDTKNQFTKNIASNAMTIAFDPNHNSQQTFYFSKSEAESINSALNQTGYTYTAIVGDTTISHIFNAESDYSFFIDWKTNSEYNDAYHRVIYPLYNDITSVIGTPSASITSLVKRSLNIFDNIKDWFSWLPNSVSSMIISLSISFIGIIVVLLGIKIIRG